MPAPLRKGLVLQMHSRQPGPLEGLDAARDILRTAKSRVGIHQRRDTHGIRDIARQLRDLREAQQADVRNASRGVGQPGAADINGRKPAPLDQTRCGGIESPRHHDALFADGPTEQRRFAGWFHQWTRERDTSSNAEAFN